MWESHADSDVRRVSKPGPDTVFPTYAVSDPDGREEDLRVAMVAALKSTPDQVEVFFRRLLASAAATPARTPKPETPMVEQLLQRLVAETQARQPAHDPQRRLPVRYRRTISRKNYGGTGRHRNALVHELNKISDGRMIDVVMVKVE